MRELRTVWQQGPMQWLGMSLQKLGVIGRHLREQIESAVRPKPWYAGVAEWHELGCVVWKRVA